METLFPPLDPEIRRQVDSIPALVDQVLPIPKRFRSGLSRDVAELSRLLTSGRGERNDSYLNEAPLLSAYLRYFLPWNVYRLARLFPSLSLPLSAGDALTDLGSGPLTLPIALWISRPDLRQLPLEFRCLDRSGPALEAGKKIFAALTGSNTAANTGCPWTIKTIRASLGEPVRFSKAKLLTAVNLFNELFWKLPGVSALSSFAEKQARILSSLTLESGSILALEPGVPRCGEFISLLRASLSAKGRLPLAPCPHAGPCPLPGIPAAASRSEKADTKWCHFAFTTTDAPAALHRLSEEARIPKERAVLSFLLAGPVNAAAASAPEPVHSDSLPVRVISDPFPLTGTLYGRYGCSARGLVLVSGKRGGVETLESGTQVTLTATTPEKRDGKSGALVLGLSATL
ncbi:small ribosomal subunit Rsm22 family protein [Treponema primitia]|uniref:small ribosomal subunit Rsm22 family protein n=1 Tax=Treponema primitia TaxID=88058 RepID=UPI00025554FC|nr:small ribosomal subunit Rsm22 family protein [Treponema primitia]